MTSRVLWRLSIVGACTWVAFWGAMWALSRDWSEITEAVYLGIGGAVAILAVGRGIAWAFKGQPGA